MIRGTRLLPSMQTWMQPPISIWEEKCPKREKIAENCIFFFVDISFCNIQMTIHGIYVFFFVDPCCEFNLGGTYRHRSSLEVKHVSTTEDNHAPSAKAIFSYARDARAHSLAIPTFCFHNLHPIHRFLEKM